MPLVVCHLCVQESASLPTPADHAERVCSVPGPRRRRRRPQLCRLGRAQTETRLQPGDLYPSCCLVCRAAAKCTGESLECEPVHAHECIAVPFFFFDVTDWAHEFASSCEFCPRRARVSS